MTRLGGMMDMSGLSDMSRGPFAFSPAGLSGRTGTYLPGPTWCFQDAALTIPCSDGDLIYTNTDLYGNGRNRVQSDSAKRPTLVNTGTGWVIRYPTTTAQLDVPGAALSGMTAAAYLAVRMRRGSVADNWNLVRWTTNADDQNSYYPFAGDVYTSFGTTTRRQFTPSLGLTSRRTFEVLGTASSWQAWLDGASQLSAGSNTVPLWASPAPFGNLTGGTADVLDECGMILCSTAPSAGDRTNVRTYLTALAP